MKLKYEKEIEGHKQNFSHLKMIVTQKDKKIKKLVAQINSNQSKEEILSNGKDKVLIDDKVKLTSFLFII